MIGSRFSWQLASPLYQQVSDLANKKLRSRIYLGNELSSTTHTTQCVHNEILIFGSSPQHPYIGHRLRLPFIKSGINSLEQPPDVCLWYFKEMKMLSDKTKLHIIFINQSLEKIIPYCHLWLCSKGVYVVDSKDTSKVRLLQFIQTLHLVICANS